MAERQHTTRWPSDPPPALLGYIRFEPNQPGEAVIEKDIKKIAVTLDGIENCLERIAAALESLARVVGNDAEDGDGDYFIRTGDIWRD